MIVSWNWLKQYVRLDMPLENLEHRLMMSGLNHEGTAEVAGDLAIDLEVTSNRPDCLGHMGVAREVAVLFGHELQVPPAVPAESGPAVGDFVDVRIDCPDLCSRYSARVIRGVSVGPSPRWMARRLEAIGLTPINNVVDISNYVLMECGQPLHTFDYGKLEGRQIVVREPKPKETIEAIDHKTYELEPGMCIIADAENPVAIGGVMGGASTEISVATTDILVEAAEFDPVSIRTTARRLNLHSDSSYRFERRVDPEGIDWASRRCCQLILDLAGGELCRGVVDVGQKPRPRQPVVLRLSQLERVLGIKIPAEEVRRILVTLGNRETAADAGRVEVVPPSWRRDLTREIDLVEEVGRIHGYDAIPEDVGVPMVASTRRREDRVVEKVRGVLTACGMDEAMTISVLDQRADETFNLWSDQPAIVSLAPVLRGADRLRRSLLPSLLMARRTNEALSNDVIELFEIARAYLPRGKKLPDEQVMLGMTSGRSFVEVKGIIEVVVEALNPNAALEATTTDDPMLEPGGSCRLERNGETVGFVGSVTPEGLNRFQLRGPTTVAEIRMDALVALAELVPQHQPLPEYPAITRDLNFVVSESVRWADLASTVRAACRDYFENLAYVDTYRDPERLGEGMKSLLMTLSLRWDAGTLTNQEADRVRDEIVAACKRKHSAELRA